MYMSDTHKTSLNGANVLSVFEIEEERHGIITDDKIYHDSRQDRVSSSKGGQPSDVGEIRSPPRRLLLVSRELTVPLKGLEV